MGEKKRKSNAPLFPAYDSYWNKKKADYIAKNGYTIKIPGLEDVFKFDISASPTEAEEKLWKKKDYEALGPERTEEIRHIKQLRKETYLDMISDPSFQLSQARSTIIDKIDDLNDGAFTGAALSAIASVFASGATKEALRSIAGWGFGAASLLDFFNSLFTPERQLVNKKRDIDGITKENPFTKKARSKNVTKFIAGKSWPAFVIQGLQTTKELFGVGISLGPIVSLPERILGGTYRYMNGDPVTVVTPWGTKKKFVRDPLYSAEALATLNQFMHHTNDDYIGFMMILANLHSQILQPLFDRWNPISEIPNPMDIVVEASAAKSLISIEILEEVDPDALDKVAWPLTGTRFATLGELTEGTAEIAKQNFLNFCERQKDSLFGLTCAFNASEAAQNTLEAFCGRGEIMYDYTAWCKSLHAILDAGYDIPPDLNPQQKACFTDWLEAHEASGTSPSLPELVAYPKNNCGFELQTR